MTIVLPPCIVGIFRLTAKRDVIVAISDLRHHRPGDPVLRLAHQALQFRHSARQAFALGFQLLAIVELVFRGIGECRGHAVAHAGAARNKRATGEQKGARKGMGRYTETSGQSGHLTLLMPQQLRLRKAGAGVRNEALR